MLLAVDVGNSSCGAALFRGDEIVHRASAGTPKRFNQRFLECLVPGQHREAIHAVVVSSVVPILDRSLIRETKMMFDVIPRFIDHRWECGMEIRVEEPEELGADRIADCAGALSLFEPPLIIIDSGTATTFDIIDTGRCYVGGAIFPGIQLALRSLADHTDKLNLVSFSVPESILGTRTETCIQAGVYYSHLGAVTMMVEEYRQLLGDRVTVVASGGLAAVFAHRIQAIDRYEPDLLYLGLKELFKRNFPPAGQDG